MSMKDNARYQTVFSILIFVAVAVLAALIFWPYLVVLSMAAAFAVIMSPIQKRLTKLVGSKDLAALLSVLLLLVVIIVPLFIIVNLIIGESTGLYQSASSGNGISFASINGAINGVAQKVFPQAQFDIRQYTSVISGWLAGLLSGLFSSTLGLVLKLFLAFVAMFYFLRDGVQFQNYLLEMSPFSAEKNKKIISSLKAAIRSVVIGSLLIACIQGFLCGFGFFLFGVPNFVLWGTAAALASFVPGVGTSIVWIPAILYLFFFGSSGIWVGELIWSILLVAFIDNFLSPFIINKGVKIHPLFILFSVLGGLQFFGPAGLLLGPLVLSLLFVIIQVIELR